MPANSYGIIVEGGYDSAVYDALIRKLASHDVRVMPRLCDGKSNLLKKFPVLLESFRYVQAGIDLAIVIADADGQDPTVLETRMRSKVTGRQYPFGVHFYVVQNAMEAWLLADVNAISKVVRFRVDKTVARAHDTPQDLIDPKPLLRRLLEEKRVAYRSAVAAEIAQQIDPQVLTAKCPRFRDFAELGRVNTI